MRRGADLPTSPVLTACVSCRQGDKRLIHLRRCTDKRGPVPGSGHLAGHEGLPLGDVAEQQVDGDGELGHVLLEAGGRVLRRLAGGLEKVLVALRVVQLEGLDAAQVVVVPAGGGGGEGGRGHLAHSLLLASSVDFCTSLSAWRCRLQCRSHCTIVTVGNIWHLVGQIVVEIVPEHAVDEDRLALEVVPERGGAEAAVERGAAGGQPVHHLVSSHQVEDALGRDEVQHAPVLPADLGDDLGGALQRLLARPAVDGG